MARNPPESCLLLFAKVPLEGRVKTRLCPPLSQEQAAFLYGAFLEDIVRASLALASPGLDLLLFVHPWEERAHLPGLPLPGMELLPQRGGGLWERMEAGFETAFARGYRKVVLRNTDSPLLPETRILEAFEALADPAVDLVLGPDRGGGFYLAGSRRSLPGLFPGLSLESEEEAGSVLERTLDRAAERSLSALLLPGEWDVDLPGDLALLSGRLETLPGRAPRTREAMAELARQGLVPKGASE